MNPPDCQIPPGKSDPRRIDTQWDDEDVLPPVLSPDTEFVFQRMTEETLFAAHSGNGLRVLDVGCGRAVDAAYLAGKGGILFGCEPSRVMLRKAREWLGKERVSATLVSSIAEDLPFRPAVFHRVVCKGAIDHFSDPEKALVEMCRVAGQRGKVIISVANFESLSCALGKTLNRFCRRIWGGDISGPHIWEIPRDHTYRFDYDTLLGLAKRHLRAVRIRGISLFWGFPKWPNLLKGLPPPAARFILTLLDKIASRHPPWGDVLVLTGKPFHPRSNTERKSRYG